MWDNAPLLRQIANVLFGLSLLLLSYGAVRYVLQLQVFPLLAVELSAAPQRVALEGVEKVVREQVRGNFFTVDLEKTRQAFERLPWVRKVSVRRKFPWRLEVAVEEHAALARWNGTALVNTHGEVFEAETDQELPAFIGQADSPQLMVQMFGEFSALLQPLRRRIVQLSLSPRHAWQARLDGGMVLELGREEMQQRLARFVRVYPYGLQAAAQKESRVDLRYRNGFAAELPGRSI